MNDGEQLNLSTHVKNLIDSSQSVENALGISVLMQGQQLVQNISSQIIINNNSATSNENLSTNVSESINHNVNQSNNNIINFNNSSSRNFQNENNLNNSNYKTEPLNINNSNRNNPLALSNNAINDIEKTIKNLEFKIINDNDNNKIEFNCKTEEKYLIVKIKNNSQNKVFENTIYACIFMLPKIKTEPQIQKEKFRIKTNEEKEWKIVLESNEFKLSEGDFTVELHFLIEENRKEIKILKFIITIIRQ
jgi:hypothetical protein